MTVSISTIGRIDMLEGAIESVIATEPVGPTLQLILNGVPPGTRERLEAGVMSRWPGPSRIVETPHRLSITKSHQLALDLCDSELINFMGDDDLCLAPRFQRAVNLFNEIPELTAVSARAHRAAGEQSVSLGGFLDLGPATVTEWSEARDRQEPIRYCFPAAVFRAEAVRSVGGCEDRWGNAFDIGISTRLGCRTPAIALTDRPFAFRIHEGSMSHQDSLLAALQSDYVLHCLPFYAAGLPEPSFEQFRQLRADEHTIVRLVRRQRTISRKHFRVAGALWVSGRRASSIRAALRSFLAWPPAFLRKLLEQRGRRL